MKLETKEMTTYKDTIQLPQSNFSMKANLKVKEPEILKYWDVLKVHQTQCEMMRDAERYVLHDGPPYANGHIHIGHALNKLLKDFVLKYQSLKGKNCVYVPGWDCHGLPIEHQVTKKLGAKAAELGKVQIREKCRAYAREFIDIQRAEFQRLGIFGHWEDPYLTMDYDYEASILSCFRRLVERGLVVKKLRPIHWSCACETALAEAELEYEEHQSPSIYVKFPCDNCDSMVFGGKPVFLLIWTTTPWTLLANRAVSVNPRFEYAYVDVGEEVWIMAVDLVETVRAKGNKKGWSIVRRVFGDALATCRYRQIYHSEALPVILSEHVTKEDGTGLVHTAPGHGYDDYLAGLPYDLPVYCPVDTRGRFMADVFDPKLKGQNVFAANDQIIDRLNHEGLLYHTDVITHSYPYCWRSKTPVIFRATEQWFITMDGHHLRDTALKLIQDEIQWIPAWGEHRIRDMVAKRPDWCISRQRSWGVAIPAFYCDACHETILDPALIQHVEDIVRREGADAWFQREVRDLLPSSYRHGDCPCESLRKEVDILDVWFDSGVSHSAVLRQHEDLAYPADLYLEGSDQHRGWFQSALLTAVGMDDTAPFKSVLTHGFVMDGDGNKMSKMQGNVVKPQAVIDQYGADILRLWVASTDYTDDMRISNDILKQIADSYRKIRNTFRYLLGNLFDYSPQQHHVPFDQLLAIDQWALRSLKQLIERLDRTYEAFQFYRVYHDVYNYCVVTLSAMYFDILKDRLYVSCKDAHARRSGQTVLYQMVLSLSKVLSPILAFTSEEVWGFINKPQDSPVSVHLASWPSWDDMSDDDAFMQQWESLWDLRHRVLKAIEEKRMAKDIGTSLEARVSLEVPRKLYVILQQHASDLAAFFIVSQVSVKESDQEVICVTQAAGKKCQRCWHYCEDVGTHAGHPLLCLRCVGAINGEESLL